MDHQQHVECYREIGQCAAELRDRLLAHGDQLTDTDVGSTTTTSDASITGVAQTVGSQYAAMQVLAQRMSQLVGELTAAAAAPRRP